MAGIGYGTQTAGSVIRPAAFNGVVGYKGTHGWADMTGIHAYAPSLDTLGFFAREANDLALIRAAYGFEAVSPPQRAPRIGLCRLPWWEMAEPYNKRNIEDAARTLRAAGAKVREWKAPESWGDLLVAQHRTMTSEAVESFAKERARHARLFSPSLNIVMAEGDAVTKAQRGGAQKRSLLGLRELSTAWEDFDLLLTPAARGEAPAGLGNTGDPVFNRSWTLLGVPCIALPFNTGPFGLPLSGPVRGPARQRRRSDRLGALGRAAPVVRLRLGLIGYGAIGKHVESALKGGQIENIDLVAALVRRPRDAASLLTHQPERFFAHKFDAVAECAGHDAVRVYGVRSLEGGADLLVTSVGAFTDDALFERVLAAAKANGRRLILPSAGIGALDIPERGGGGRPRHRHRHGAQGSLRLEGHRGRIAGRSRRAEKTTHRIRWPGARGCAALSAEREHLRGRRDRRDRPRPDPRRHRGRSHDHDAYRRAGSARRLRELYLQGRRGGQRGEPQDRQARGHGNDQMVRQLASALVVAA